jgi:hypothetical protein
MGKYPKPREMPGFEVYFVTVDRGRIQQRMAEGWEIHPDYLEAYEADPTACDSWPMRRPTQGETETFGSGRTVEVAVEATPEDTPEDEATETEEM